MMNSYNINNDQAICYYIIPKSLIGHDVIKIISSYEGITPIEYIESSDNIIVVPTSVTGNSGVLDIIDTFRVESYNSYESEWFREYIKEWKFKLDELFKQEVEFDSGNGGSVQYNIESIKIKLNQFIQDSKIKYDIFKNQFDGRYISNSLRVIIKKENQSLNNNSNHNSSNNNSEYGIYNKDNNNDIGYKEALKHFAQQLSYYNLEQVYNKSNPLGINSWFSLAKFTSNISESKSLHEYSNIRSDGSPTSNILFDGYSDSLSYFSQNNHILCFSNNNNQDNNNNNNNNNNNSNNNNQDNSNSIGFNSNSFNQILLELINGIYNYNSLPVFSLQLNSNNQNIDPIIHPVYRDTLVGKVLLALDYYMKGFLSGGFISSDYITNYDIQKQQQNQQDEEEDGGSLNEKLKLRELKRNIIDIKYEIESGEWSYLKEKINYKSLRERSFDLGLEGDDNLASIESVLRNLTNKMGGDQNINSLYKALDNLNSNNGSNKFNVTFRMVGKENSCEMKDGIWISDNSFNVEYIIETSKTYQEYIDAYKCVFGDQLPKDFQLLNQLYKDAAESISNQLPLLPPCKKYFQMFSQISFLSSYLSTLKSLNQIPNVHQIKESLNQIVNFKTPLFIPPLPIRYYKTIQLSITIDDVISFINLNNNNSNNSNNSSNKDEKEENINELCVSVYIELNDYFKQISNLNNSSSNDNNSDKLKNNIVNKFSKIIHKMIEIKYNHPIRYNSIYEQLEILSNTFISLLEIHIDQVIIQQYSVLFSVLGTIIKSLEDNDIKASDVEFGSIPWLSSNEIFNQQELINIIESSSSLSQVEKEEFDRIYIEKIGNVSKFRDECIRLNIGLDDLKNSCNKLLNRYIDLMYTQICSGGCNGSFELHFNQFQVSDSSCRIESLKILKEIYSVAIDQLEEKKRNENWLSSIFSGTKNQITNIENKLSSLQDSNIEQHSEFLFHYLKDIFGKIEDENHKLKETINSLFQENLSLSINLVELLFKLLKESPNNSINIIELLTQNRNLSIKSQLSNNNNNTNNSNNDTLSTLLNYNLLPFSKLDILSTKSTNNNQTIFGASCIFDFQSSIKIQPTFKRKSLSVEAIKNQFENQFNKWMNLNNSKDLVGFQINILSMDSISSVGNGDYLTANYSNKLSIINIFYQYINDEELFINYISNKELDLLECDKYGNNILHLSSLVGNIVALKSMLSRIGIEYLNVKNDFGYTPLICSTIMGQVKTVEHLLSPEYKSNLKLNIKSNNGFTALVISVLEGYSEISRLLINNSSFIELDSQFNKEMVQYQNSIIHLSLESNQIDLAIELVEKGVSPFISRALDSYNSFELAVSLGQLEFVKHLFKYSNIQLIESVNRKLIENQNTPIHIACQNGSLIICDWLINNGFPGIAIQNYYGYTPLMLALENGYPEIANLILNYQPINSHFREEYSPLDNNNNYGQLVYQFTNNSYGSFINCKKQTSLMLSISKGYTDISWFILKQGKELWDFIDQNGYKLLDYIILFGESSLFDKLSSSELLPLSNYQQQQQQIEQILIPSSSMSPSSTYLEFALKQKNNELVNVLLNYFNIENIDLFKQSQDIRSINQPYSIIHLAVRSNHIKLVNKWIEKVDLVLSKSITHVPTSLEIINKLNINVGNSVSQSLLSIAAENGSLESLELLLNSNLYKSSIEKFGLNSVLSTNGIHLLYYALVGRSKKTIEYLVKSSYYIDQLNIELVSDNQDINIVSVLLSTHQHHLLPFFSSHGLKIYQFGFNSVNEAIKIGNYESIEYFIQKANIELIQNKMEPIGDTFYFNLWLRSITNSNSQIILQIFNQQIISSLLNIKLKYSNQESPVSCLSSSEYQLFKNIGEQLLIELIINKRNLETVQELLKYLPTSFINIDEVINTLEQIIIVDDFTMLMVLYRYFNSTLNNIKDIQEIIFNYCIKYKSVYCLESMYKETNEMELLDELNAIKDQNIIKENEEVYSSIFEALEKKKDLVLLKILQTSIGDSLPSLVIKDIPILVLAFNYCCEKSFEYCLSKGCIIFDSHEVSRGRSINKEVNEYENQQQHEKNANLLLCLAKDYTNLGSQLLILKKYLNQDIIQKLFNQEINIDLGLNISLKFTHWDLLLTILNPDYIQEAYNHSTNIDQENIIIEFANSFGLSLKEKQQKEEEKEDSAIEQIIQGIGYFNLSNNNNRSIPNQRYSNSPNRDNIDHTEFKPKLFVLPNKHIDSNLLLVAIYTGKSNWLNEWFNFKLINKLEFDQSNRVDKISITYLEKRYHYRRMVQIINRGDQMGAKPLMYASIAGNLECVKILVENGGDPTYTDPKGNSSISYAANSNSDNVIWYLLPYSLSVINQPNSNNDYLISLASEKGLSSLVSRLLKYNSFIDNNGNFNKLSLSKACYFNKSNTIKKLLSIKRLLLPVNSSSTQSSLSAITSSSSTTTTKDISKINNNSSSEENSILNYSISQITSLTTSLSTYKLLWDEIGLEDDRSNNNYNNDNRIDFANTPFEIAVQNNNLTMIEYMISFSQQLSYSKDLWIKIVLSDNPKLIQLLSSPNELLSSLSNLKLNALHIAALRKCHKIVLSLIKLGVSPVETCLYENTTPLQLASSLGNCQFIKSLLRSLILQDKEKFNQVLISSCHSSGGKSALELALFNNHITSAYLLIQVIPNLSVYKPSLKLLNYIASNPSSQNNWSDQEFLFKLLAIYGDSSISSINLNSTLNEESNDNKFVSTFYSSSKFKLLQKQIDKLDFNGSNYQDQLNRSIGLGFTHQESKELLSVNWLYSNNSSSNNNNSNNNNDLGSNNIRLESYLLDYLNDVNSSKNISLNKSSKLFLELVFSKLSSNSQNSLSRFIYEYNNNNNGEKEEINNLLNEAYNSLNQIQDNELLISMFDKEISSKWSWKFMFIGNGLFTLLDRLMKFKNNQIYYWFISHFTAPIKSLFVDSKEQLVQDAYKRFEDFIRIFENDTTLIQFLPYPPTDLQLSYQNQNGRDNMQLAIDSIEKQVTLKSIQVSFLQYLPKSTEYIQLSLKRSLPDRLLVCRQSFELSSLLLDDIQDNDSNDVQVLDLIPTCSLSLLKVFRGLKNQDSINQLLKSRFLLNYQTNLRILQMINPLEISIFCKIELINYINFILESNQYNVISSGDILESNSSNRIDWCRDMQIIISQLPQIIKYLGDWYFKSFLNVISNNQNNSSGGGNSLKLYIDITQKLLSFSTKISVNQIWEVSNYKELELLFKKVSDNEVKNKINQIPFNQVWEYFESPLNSQPLNEKDLSVVKEMYLQFELIQDQFKDMTIQNLIEFSLIKSKKILQQIKINKLNQQQEKKITNSHEIDEDVQDDNNNNTKEELVIFTNKVQKLTIKLLSSLCWLIYYEFGIFPYSTQVCCVFGLLLYNNNNKELNGRISQVLTGEGKSTIVALFATYCSLLNRSVDIITTSEYLAYRDYIKFERLFKLLNITSSHICGEQPSNQQFQAQVLFGTNTNFEFAQLRDNLYDSRNLYESDGITQRKKDVVIVDEVDSLFMDSALNSARMAISSNDTHEFMYKPISNYVYSNFISKLNDKQLSKLSDIMYDDGANYKDDYLLLNNPYFKITFKNIQDVRQILTDIVSSLPSSYDEKTKQSLLINWLNSLNDDKNIKLILDNAIKSFVLKEGFDYVIIQDNNEQQQSKSVVVIVDKSNTGRLMIGSRFSDGLHEFLEVKHGLLPEKETLTAAAISHPSFFGQYNCVFGLTGTCGEQSEREELMKVYNVDSFNVPSYRPSKRIQLESKLFKTNQEHQDYIINEIKEIAINKSRPVLLLLPTIKESQSFINTLQLYHNIQPQLLNEMQQEDEEFIITRAGEPGIVTVATNTAGRGTDIKLTNQSIKNGGLHVIFGFYPKNLRVENQGLGRSGRQGQVGTCRILISLENLDLDLYNNNGDTNNNNDNNSDENNNSNNNNFINENDNSNQIMEQQFKLLDKKRSEKCSNLSSLRLAQCIVEKEQFKLLERYFKLLSTVRNFLNSNQFLDSINEIIQDNQNDQIVLLKCSCNDKQFSTFLDNSLYLNLLDSCSKLLSTAITTNTKLNNQNNYKNNLQSLADRVKQSIIDFIQQEWAQFFTFNFSTRSKVPLIEFNIWWYNTSISHCLESSIESHFKKLINELILQNNIIV